MAVDISDLPPPPKGTDISDLPAPPPAPKTRKVGMPDFSERTKIPEEAAKRNRALMLGLGTSLATPLGQIEQMVTPESKGELKGQETVFTTPQQLREGLQKSGIVSKLSPEEEKYAGYGELVPAVALGGKALKQGLGLAADYLGNTSLGKTLSKGYQNVTGKTAAKAAQEAEALGAKVKSQTEASVSERAAAERTAEKEAAARAKELGSSKNRELQSQADITQAKGAVSQKLIADKTKATKATENALKNLSNKATTEEEVGGLIQPLGKSNVKKLSELRQKTAITEIKDPAFDRARGRESNGEFLITNKQSAPLLESAFADLETQINRTTEPYQSQLKARLQSLKGKEVPLSEGELRVERLKETSIPGYSAKTTKQEPLTLDQAEFMRRMLTDKDLAEATGFAALDISQRVDVAKKLVAAMKEFEPGVGKYLSKYQETSAPITKALTGRGGQLTEAERLAEEEILFSADKSATAKYYLDGSKERANRLLDLVGGKPKELVNSIAGLVRGKMEKMTAKQAEDFTKQGLFEIFPELKSPANQIVKAKQAEEKAASLLGKQGAIATTGPTGRLAQALGTQSSLEKKLAQSAKEAATTAEKAKDSAIKFETFNTHLGTLSGEDSLLQSKNFLRKMAEENRIPQDAYQRSLQEIQQAEAAFQKFKDADTLKKNLRRALTYKALATTVGGGTAYYFTH